MSHGITMFGTSLNNFLAELAKRSAEKLSTNIGRDRDGGIHFDVIRFFVGGLSLRPSDISSVSKAEIAVRINHSQRLYD